jgi:hypothetical protein
MNIVMTIVARGMIMGIAVGAVGGWLIFVLAWIKDLHAGSYFQKVTRRAGLQYHTGRVSFLECHGSRRLYRLSYTPIW